MAANAHDHRTAAFSEANEEDIEEMSKEGLRAKLLYAAATREDPSTQLKKKTLNSLHARLTGEFAVRPDYLYMAQDRDDVPNVPTLRRLVYGAATDPESLAEAMNRQKDGRLARPFVKDELREIAEETEARGDQRDWT